jgi:hypothetical protein
LVKTFGGKIGGFLIASLQTLLDNNPKMDNLCGIAYPTKQIVKY